ncbi:hypothetical protein GCM10025867_47180 (plasmid) [Frondihabitans sucicola]|uniref:Cytochrome n=1 Tax=Frondihabitans sucicola TaxID=1268041 RepID=A0ABN6Y558_9MICO|nr:hypothetical protein [Frondihabitans sucicola]BDZ52477.1 hypothetical protein GCM10025867_47180 [Frondihabitans sucicola]
MTSPKLAQQTKWGRMYARTRGGRAYVPSITTVLDVFNPEMGWWDGRCAADEAVRNAEAIVAALATARSDADRERILKGFTKQHSDAAERDRNIAADRGDFVHDYAEQYFLHLLGLVGIEAVDEARENALAQGLGAYLEQFHRFVAKFNPIPVAPEATVWNETVGYAGTTDLICYINDVLCILDWKTKKKVLERDRSSGEMVIKHGSLKPLVALQLSAAAHGEEFHVMNPDGETGEWKPFEFDIQVGIAVGIGPDDVAVRPFDIWHPRVFKSFEVLAEAWNWRWLQDRVMGPDLFSPEQITADMLPSRRELAAA